MNDEEFYRQVFGKTPAACHQHAAEHYTILENAIRDMLLDVGVEMDEDYDIFGKGTPLLVSIVREQVQRLRNQEEVIRHYQRAMAEVQEAADIIGKVLDTSHPFVSDTGSEDYV